MTLYNTVLQHYIEQTTSGNMLDLLDTPRYIFALQYWQRSVQALDRLQNFPRQDQKLLLIISNLDIPFKVGTIKAPCIMKYNYLLGMGLK